MAKIAVVTGASGGIGSACAKKLAKEGYTVIVHYFRHKDEAEHIASRIGGEAVQADLRSEAAVDALGLHLYSMELDGDSIPAPTPVRDLRPEEGGVVSMIEVFMPAVRDRINRKAVKKTVTIPAWLNREAEAAGSNFSLILQNGLKSYLGKGV